MDYTYCGFLLWSVRYIPNTLSVYVIFLPLTKELNENGFGRLPWLKLSWAAYHLVYVVYSYLYISNQIWTIVT